MGPPFFEPLDAPVHKRPLGKPKKSRRRKEDGVQDPHNVRKIRGSLRCSNCMQWRHNARTWKGPKKNKLPMKEAPKNG